MKTKIRLVTLALCVAALRVIATITIFSIENFRIYKASSSRLLVDGCNLTGSGAEPKTRDITKLSFFDPLR